MIRKFSASVEDNIIDEEAQFCSSKSDMQQEFDLFFIAFPLVPLFSLKVATITDF